MHRSTTRIALACLAGLCLALLTTTAFAQAYLDNQAQYSNQDPNTETRRSDHFRLCFGHYNRDTGTPMTEQLAQGNLQMYEQMWNHWVNELGLHDINESVTAPDGNKYKTNFNFLMTWNDGGGGGAYSSMDSAGFFYAMANTGYCRYDPPSGATPHEMGHAWEGSCAGFNGSDSSGAWWECTANWMQLQFLNSYPQAGGYLYNSVFYPAHGRDYYDSWMIWEAAREDPRYGATWVNEIWTNATADQQAHEYIVDRMIRLDTSGSADKPGAVKDLWGDMAKKMVTWDYERQRWFIQANTPWNGDTWEWYTRCRAPLVKMPGTTDVYRPNRAHIPQEFGFHYVPLTASAGATVSCNFQPLCDPIRQSDWRACLVAVSNNGDARYSSLWNVGTNSITLSADEDELYLMVIAVPKPMKVVDPAWPMYTSDAGLQFPYTVSFTNATPANVIYPVQSHTGMHQHSNGGGWVSDTATVDSTAYVGPNAQVLNSAQVRGNARIEEYGTVRNNAQVRDNAIVSGHAVVYENAQVYGNAKVRDWAMIFGYAELYENAKAIEHAGCGGGDAARHSKVYGSVTIKGVTSVYSPSTFYGSLITDGDTANGNLAPGDSGYVVADHGAHFGWQWGHNPSIFSQLTDNAYQYSGLTFERQNPVFACDQYGINHGYLMNGCRNTIDSGGTPRGGYVLALNGTNQYVELHNSLNDFKDMSVAVWVKWTGTANDQRIWSMGDGVNKQMWLTPNNSTTSRVRFTITDGTTTQYIDGASALGTGWTHVVVTFSGNTGTLYVNGSQAGQNTSMTLDPDALNAPLMENANYLGRGNTGNYFQGSVDDFRVYNKTLASGEVTTLYNTAAPSPVTPTTDTTAPTPNAATWLVAPTAISDSAITMSATPGTDASNWVEYYFTCTAGGGHDSGWVSFNKYTDVGLTPSTAYTYTVKMRDQNGNTTTASSALGATTQTSSSGVASFAYGPVGISSTAITMRANKLSNASGLTEYKFTRNDSVTSGWQSSPTWTNTGLTANSTYTYTVQIRDGRGNTSAVSAPSSATARDMAAPMLPLAVAQWTMMPYATIDNKISMTAQTPTSSDTSGVQYYFHCTAGGLPDSGWQDSPTYVTAVVADGTYTFQYKVRDKSAQYNESGYSGTYSATIKPTTGYHACTFAQTATLPDDSLVTFSGQIVSVNADNYTVKDTGSSSTITVKPDTYGLATNLANAFKNVTVKGHLYTIGGTRLVTHASLTVTGSPQYSISGKVTKTGGANISGATVYFKASPDASVNPAGTTTTDSNGNYTMPIINGTWYVCAGGFEYITSADQTVTMNSANVTNINFTLAEKPKISGKVTDQSGVAIAGASVCFSPSPDAASNPTYTATTDASGNYTQIVSTGTWCVCAGKANYLVTADQAVNANGIINNINFALAAPASRNVPQSSQLIFSAVTDPFGLSGSTGNWPTYLPSGQTLEAMGTPVAKVFSAKKWVNQVYADNDGFRQGNYASPIACNGASIVVAVKPTRNAQGTSWTSVVDVFYDRLVLGVKNDTGRVCVRRNGSLDLSTAAIPDGQVTVLSMVVQPTGQYKVWANGTEIMNNTTTSTMTSLVPGVAGGYATYINVGRNNPDGWTTFNGNIGDVYLYKVSLSDTERQQLENDLTARFGNGATYTITASAGTGGTITPSGTVTVISGASQTFTIAPSVGYSIANVLVDGVSQGVVASYTFDNVLANHTISATFVPTLHTITASAGANGTISPSGAVDVVEASSQTFTITPNANYVVDDVLVDGASVGRVTSYTFDNVMTDHTISATFKVMVLHTITATAGANGSISPSGAVSVIDGNNQTFTITANNTYAIDSVLVDGVNVGSNGTYTFTNVIANHTISASFTYVGRNIPRTDQLIFSVDTNTFPDSGNTGPWATFIPAGQTLATIGTPTVELIDGVKWEKNIYADYDGYRQARYASSLAVNGVTIVAAVKPTYVAVGGEARGEIVDIFYDRLALAISHTDGRIMVARNYWNDYGPAIPDGQKTILSLVVQVDGSYKVFANGTQVMTGGANGNWTSINPDHTPTWGSDPDFTHYINVGRNNPDGWSTFNGNIGDVFLYKVALSDAERQMLEADLTSKFLGGTPTYTITASAGTGGTITPSGSVVLDSGANQTFDITPDTGYAIADVSVDGVSQGPISSYTFTNVTANHTISATFSVITHTITASAGAGGTINPSGSVVVNYGDDQAFTIAANGGYTIADVLVDGVSQGPISSYTFTDVTADHTISATFSAIPTTYTITASAGTGGTISPSGDVVVNSGDDQTFTITPDTGYYILDVTVDGVSQGAVSSLTLANVTADHTVAATFANDMVAYYKFNETTGTSAFDSSGNSETATLAGSCSWVAGKTGNAVNIPGGTSYVSLPSGIVSGLTNFSVVGWVKLTTVTTNMRIFDFGTSTTNYMELTPKHSNTSGKVQFVIKTSATTKTVSGSGALPTGSWQHVVVTLSGQTLALYVNGTRVGRITNCTLTPSSLGTTTNNWIGDSQTSSHPHLNGLVDGFRIYNRALTASEITTLYGGGSGAASFPIDNWASENLLP